jgi:tRNA-binding protein
MATIEEFQRIEMRVGTVIRAEPFPEARLPALKLWIDFGVEIGERRSSARITTHYSPSDLIGRQIVAVVNFPARRVAGFSSEVLVLGAMVQEQEVVLLSPDRPVENGIRIA